MTLGAHRGITGRTGEICLYPGWYRSLCHWNEDMIPMRANKPFPPCNQKHSWQSGPEGNAVSHSATWEWVADLN